MIMQPDHCHRCAELVALSLRVDRLLDGDKSAIRPDDVSMLLADAVRAHVALETINDAAVMALRV